MRVVRILFILIGLAAVLSSWFSVQPSSEHRNRELMERYEADPNAVMHEEWLKNYDDEGSTAVLLIIVGIPAFVLVTITAGVISKGGEEPRSPSICFGIAWILLGQHFMHFYGHRG